MDPQENPTPTPPLAVALPPLQSRAQQRRSLRVTALVVGVAAVSLADLYLTLTFLRSGGMNEANPLARWVIEYNCPWLLGCWKVLLVALTCTILFFARRRRSGELAAWICAGVMIWLTFQWTNYAERAHMMTGVPDDPGDFASLNWVKIDP